VTRAQAQREAAALLRAAGVDGAARDAALLVRWAAGSNAADPDAPLGDAERARLCDGVARRAARAPLSHILGERAFWEHRFAVSADVLDPRPETETLVAWALEGRPAARIIDLGVGSGCILLSLLAAWPSARGLGVDASAAALAMAERNAAALGVSDRATFARGDWLDGVTGPFDLAVANPPYLTDAEMAALGPELRAEPVLALAGGPDGLEPYRRIAPRLRSVLTPDGSAFFEIGAGQAAAVAAILLAAGLGSAAMRPDMDGRMRVLRVAPV